MAAVICVFIALAFAFNAPLAVLAVLDENGVTADRLNGLLSDLLSAENILSKEEDAFNGAADAVWRLAKTLESCGFLMGAAAAYADPPAAGNPFLLFKYASVDFSAGSAVQLDLSRYTKEALQSGAEQLRLIARGMVERGEEAFYDCAETLYDILQSEDVLAQVSYKDMFGVYDYAVGVSAQADFALLFPLDALAAPDFVKTQAEGIRSAQALLRSIDYPLFLNIITYLPDIPAFLCALCVHAASLENFDIAAFSSAAEWVGRTAGANLDAALLTDYFSYLAECSPDDLSGSARAKAEEFADYLKAAFPS